MDATDGSLVKETQAGTEQEKRLMVRGWVWRPWYAKLWWLGTVIYWAGMALSFYVHPMKDFYSTALAGYLNVCFYPPAILMILGLGFLRAKIARGDWVIVAGDPPLHRFNRSESGSLDPYSDPLDHRSGSLWVGSPQNRARIFGREWP